MDVPEGSGKARPVPGSGRSVHRSVPGKTRGSPDLPLLADLKALHREREEAGTQGSAARAPRAHGALHKHRLLPVQSLTAIVEGPVSWLPSSLDRDFGGRT